MGDQPSPPSSPTSPTQFYRRPLPDTCLSFSSDEGKEVFAEALAAGYMNCYFGLAAQFRTQDEPAFCGLSTLVMVLNTLEIDPGKVWKGPWRWYHENMLDCCVPLEVVKTDGINLQQFACLAECNTLHTEVVQATDHASEGALRDAIKHCTSSTDKVLVASYSRKLLKQTGDGHFSPIGGYHPGRDLVLILDTARFKYPPHWVTVSLLWQTMQALDGTTGMPRGYLILSKRHTTPLLMFRLSPDMSIFLSSAFKSCHGASAFCQKWDQCICGNLMEGDTANEKEVIHGAVLKLLDCLMELSQDSPILCTQIDVSCPEKLSGDHCCAANALVRSLEKTVMFEIISDCIKDDPQLVAAAERLGRCSSFARPGCCSGGTAAGGGTAKDGGTAEGGIGTCTLEQLGSKHFVTMLMLSWPTQKCNSTLGQIIQRAASDQLASSDEVLQNEVSVLRQQFESVLNYCSSQKDSAAVANILSGLTCKCGIVCG